MMHLIEGDGTEYPIIFSYESQPILLFTINPWNNPDGLSSTELTEIHTIESFKEKYENTPVYDSASNNHWNSGYHISCIDCNQVLEELLLNNELYTQWTKDNMTIQRIR